jgi:hypothetical protein
VLIEIAIEIEIEGLLQRIRSLSRFPLLDRAPDPAMQFELLPLTNMNGIQRKVLTEGHLALTLLCGSVI